MGSEYSEDRNTREKFTAEISLKFENECFVGYTQILQRKRRLLENSRISFHKVNLNKFMKPYLSDGCKLQLRI